MGTIAVSGLTGFGPDTSIPQDANTDYVTFTNDVSYTRGHHVLKTGVLLERAATQTMLGNNIRGGHSFPSLARFLAGQPASFSSVLPGADITRSRSSMLFGAYLQDDWAVATRLVLNLGMRYETYGVPKDSGGQDSALRNAGSDKDFVVGPIFVNPSRANIGPRVGFAWDVTGDGRTSVRGGAGLYFDTDGVFNSSLLISTFAPPFASTINLVNPAFPRPVLEGGNIGLSARTIDYNVGQPRMWTFNLSAQRQLPGDLGLLVSYAGSRGYDLVRAVEGNPFVPQTLADGTLFVPANARRVNPNWGSIDYRTTGGHSWYDALQLMLRKRFSKGYQFQASYTLSETVDETQGQVSLDVSNSSIYGQNPYNQAGDRGPADFDVRHVLTFNAAWDLPLGRSLTGIAGVFGKGWQINALGTFRIGSAVHADGGQQLGYQWPADAEHSPSESAERGRPERRASYAGAMVRSGRVRAAAGGCNGQCRAEPAARTRICQHRYGAGEIPGARFPGGPQHRVPGRDLQHPQPGKLRGAQSGGLRRGARR